MGAITSVQNQDSNWREASRYLDEFERTKDAWQLSFTLITLEDASDDVSDSRAVYRLHGARLLYAKLLRDVHQLSEDEKAPLTQNIVGIVIKLCQAHQLEMNTCRFLCLSIAALALQNSQQDVVHVVLEWFNDVVQSRPIVVLELLKVLAVECNNDRYVEVSVERIDDFCAQLTNSIPQVFDFLSLRWNCLHSSEAVQGTDTVDEKKLVIECLMNWIDFTNIPGLELARQDLLISVLDTAMLDQELIEAVGELIVCIYHKYGCHISELNALIYPRVLRLREVWNTILQDPQVEHDSSLLETCETITKIFVEIAEGSESLIFSSKAVQIGQMEIVSQLLECCRFKYDLSTSLLPVRFFGNLCLELGDANERKMDAAEIGDRDGVDAEDFVLNTYTPILGTFLEIGLEQMCVDESLFVLREEGESHNDDRDLVLSEDDVEKRKEWVLFCKDASEALYSDKVLQRLGMLLQEKIGEIQSSEDASSVQWAPIESILFALQAILPDVRDRQNEVIHWLLETVLSFPNLHLINLTKIDLLGKAGFYLALNPDRLGEVLEYLCSTLKQRPYASRSARAIMGLLQKCRDVENLYTMVTTVNEILVDLRQSHGIKLDDDLDILEGMAEVLSAMQDPQLKETQMEIVYNCLSSCIAEVEQFKALAQGNGVTNGSHPAASVDRISIFMKHLDVIERSDYLTLATQIMDVLQQVLAVAPHSEVLTWNICQVYKHIIRHSKEGFLPFVETMVDHLITQFSQQMDAGYICAAEVLLVECGNYDDEGVIASLSKMLETLCTLFFANITNEGQIEEHSGLVTKFFKLLESAIEFTPLIYFQAISFNTTPYTVTTIALQIHHRGVFNGAIRFLGKFFGLYLRDRWSSQRQMSDPQNQSQVKTAVLEIGRNVGDTVIQACIIALSSRALSHIVSEALIGSDRKPGVLDVIGICRKIYNNEEGLFSIWLAVAIQNIPDVQRDIFLEMNAGELLVEPSTHIRECQKTLSDFHKKAVR